jgi:hypothetical protein
MGTTLDPANLLSDFEDVAAATIVQAGTPARNGYWYSYNDWAADGVDKDTCMQTPMSGPQAMAKSIPTPTYVGEAPPSADGSGQAGSLALHAQWNGCSVWGAGIGADLNQPMLPDGGTYSGPKVPYDLTGYTGVTFWAAVTPNSDSDTALRIKFPMTDETKVADGGNCVEDTNTKCSDDFGYKFNLPANGNWKQITVKFSDAAFATEGWGKQFPWNPMHVTSIQIQSQNMGEKYDFWIDDMYLTK